MNIRQIININTPSVKKQNMTRLKRILENNTRHFLKWQIMISPPECVTILYTVNKPTNNYFHILQGYEF